MSDIAVSISLPSLYPEALVRALRNIADATALAYEVIVVSPFPPAIIVSKRGRIKWMPEGAPKGCNAAHRNVLSWARGEFITAWVDDHFYADGWDVEAIRDFKLMEQKGKILNLGLRHTTPTHVGTVFGIYYPYFPFMRRDAALAIDWYSDAYITGFADSDLALRVWSNGGVCKWSDQSLITVHADDGRKNGVIYQPEDMQLFIERWAPKYGQGWDTSDLRGFNNDITPARFPQFVTHGGRSIYYNNPDFKPVVGVGG